MTERPTRRTRLRLLRNEKPQPGAYVVTVCTVDRVCVFGAVDGTEMRTNDLGDAVAAVWRQIPLHYDGVALDRFIVMPNHVHGILIVGGRSRRPLSEVVRGFKTLSTSQVNLRRDMPGAPLWQRGFYEDVIPDETDMARVREYIVNNPAQWARDEENPDCVPGVSGASPRG